MARPAYKIDASCGGSDLAGETAAAMAASLDGVPAHRRRLRRQAARPTPSSSTRSPTPSGRATSDCITDAASLLQVVERLPGRAGLGRDLAVPGHRRRHLPGQGGERVRQARHRAADHHPLLQVDDRLGQQAVRRVRAAGQPDRQAEVRRRRQPVARLVDRRRQRRPGPLLARRRGRARLAGARCATPPNTAFAALVYSDKTTDTTRKARYHDFARPPDQLRARRQPAQVQLRHRLRRQLAAEPAPPHRARLLVGQPDRARRDPARALRRAGRRPVLGQRRVHRQPVRLRDERGRHRLQRRLHLRAGPAVPGVRRHPAGRLPDRRDSRTWTS